jgi:hypothetical protein
MPQFVALVKEEVHIKVSKDLLLQPLYQALFYLGW